MGSRVLVGVAGPDSTYAAYYLQWGEHPVRMIPRLREQWQQRGGDTAAMADALHTPPSIGDADWSTGHLGEIVDEGLEWLFLLHEQAGMVEAYIATAADRWRVYSRHRLATTADDLFVLDRQAIRCTRCRTVDGVTFTTTASSGGGNDTVIACEHCGATETTDPDFTTRTAT